MGLGEFPYDEDHEVIVCMACGTCLGDGKSSWERQLRAEPHRMKGEQLRQP